jgi:hypothetical protein
MVLPYDLQLLNRGIKNFFINFFGEYAMISKLFRAVWTWSTCYESDVEFELRMKQAMEHMRLVRLM